METMALLPAAWASDTKSCRSEMDWSDGTANPVGVVTATANTPVIQVSRRYDRATGLMLLRGDVPKLEGGEADSAGAERRSKAVSAHSPRRIHTTPSATY
jgi:hypothetical protein